MAKTGLKSRGRYPGGQIRHSDRQKGAQNLRPGEQPDNPTLAAQEARLRQLWGVERWLSLRGNKAAMEAALREIDNPLMGSVLGRLLLVGRKAPAEGIAQSQYDAASYFGWIYRANAKVRGWPSPNAKALDYGAAAPGFSTHDEDSDEYVTDIKRKWSDLYGTVMEADNRQGKVFEALKRVLLEDQDADVGELRMGLNAINRARGVK